MSALKDSKNMTIVGMVVVAVLAFVFWKVLLSPKREEAADLGQQIEQVEASLAQHEAEVTEGEEARDGFPVDYQKLVVLGKAVPGDDDTASLLAQVSHIAADAKVRFQTIELASGGGEGEETSALNPAAGEGSVPPTEAAAALMPLGASIGPAGLGAMPYYAHLQGQLLQDGRLHQGPRFARQDRRGTGRRRRSPADDRRLLPRGGLRKGLPRARSHASRSRRT